MCRLLVELCPVHSPPASRCRPGTGDRGRERGGWFFFFFFNVYLLLRERQSARGGGAEREGDIESEAGARLRAVSTEPDTGLELTKCEIMT